jgi:cytochrome c oxidase accessory protein FixG
MQDKSGHIPVTELDAIAPAEVSERDLYQKREKIYTRQIQGFFQRIRLFTGWPLLAAYFLLPWLDWGDRQAVLFDLPARQFHILGLTFWPQDLMMLAWILVISAFALFFFTTLFGRVWCGYSCPQTVWTSIFMWVEQKTEGSRNQRIKLDAAPWSANKVIRKSLKHILWLFVGFYTGFTFVGYFSPIKELGYQVFILDLHPWEFFWVGFFTVATYINAGWLREQVCIYMCPYARFQSAMFDHNTLIVSYDPARGEQRGSRKRDVEPSSVGLGDCIDCQLCVQVCPTGIDIRDGLQPECIGCALCIDACNSIMKKMDYAPNLISYTTENKLLGKPQKILRPKVIAYGAALSAFIFLFLYVLLSRVPVELDILRDRGQLYIEKEGNIENTYTIKILNMDTKPQRFVLSVDGLDGLVMTPDVDLVIDSGKIAELPVKLSLDRNKLPRATNVITFEVQAPEQEKLSASQESRFLGPSPSRN